MILDRIVTSGAYRTGGLMLKLYPALAILIGCLNWSASAHSEESMALHPDFPVVSGDYKLTEDWAITLPQEMNRRFEDQDLVLWRPGFTIWMSLWNNDHDETIQERIQRLQSNASRDAFSASVRVDEVPARYSYRLNEDREEGIVYALYGFALKDDGHLQVAIYADSEDDIAEAKSIFDSIR